METINVYCDESCYLQHDHFNIMVAGALSCDQKSVRALNKNIREIKKRHKVFEHAEIKWVKVSKSKLQMYKELVDLFFETPELHFRAVVAQGKNELDLERYNLTYDEWYYRIYYLTLKEVVTLFRTYNIYLDIKDTRGYKRIEKLKEVLNHTLYDFSDSTVKKIQLVRSDQIDLMGLADLLIGTVSYSNRGLNTCQNNSQAKKELVDYIQSKLNQSLLCNTNRSETKFNIFHWRPNVNI